MAKKRKNNQRSYQANNNNDLSTTLIIVAVSIIVIGIGTWLALREDTGSGNGNAVNSGVGQSIGSLEGQVKTLTEQANSDPKNAGIKENLGTALFNLANEYRNANDPRANETYSRTIQAYNETLELNPNSKETLGDMATAYFYTNQVDLAILTVEKALKLDSNFLPARMNYGIYLADGKRDYKKAIEQWKKIPFGTPQYSQAQSLIEQYKN